MPALRPRHTRLGEHSRPQLPPAARPLQRLPGAASPRATPSSRQQPRCCRGSWPGGSAWGWQLPAALLLTWALVALTLIDIDRQLLPDQITLPFLWLGLLLSTAGVYTDPVSSILGAAAGYLALWSVYHLFRLLTGKEGMGYGDFKLLALFGAWLGWQLLPQIILLSALVGSVVGVGLVVLRRHGRDVPIPFGPYLAAAGWVAVLWGGQINAAYLQFAGIG